MNDKPLYEMTEDELIDEINNLIDNAPADMQPRLKGLQWKCDMIRKKHGTNHTGAMLEIQTLMMESVRNLQVKLGEFISEVGKK